MNKMFIGTMLLMPVIYVGFGLMGLGEDPVKLALMFVEGLVPATVLVIAVFTFCLSVGVFLIALSYSEQRKRFIESVEKDTVRNAK